MDSHVPVLLEEALLGLAVRADGVYVDGTFGRGGHSRRILAALGPGGRLLAMDRDPEAVMAGRELQQCDSRFVIQQESFGQLRRFLEVQGVNQVDGILLDLGVSSPQFDSAARGFSFRQDGPLDMRMDPASAPSAAAWLNAAGEGELAGVFRRLGEEPAAGRIARAICRRRAERPILTTLDLAAIVEAAAGHRRQGGKHPATRVFQAIRMHVNRELEEIEAALAQALEALRAGGRLCVISFHSLEDRIVKRFMRDHSRVDPRLSRLPVVPESARPRLRLVGGAVRPGDAEVARNPRSRSAVLRVAEMLP